MLALHKNGGGESQDVILVDPVDCDGLCTSTSLTTDQIPAVIYNSDSSICCAVNVTVRQRRCMNLGVFINEIEILRVEPQEYNVCECSVQEIMYSTIKYVLNDSRSILGDTTLYDYDVYVRTSKCWEVDPEDNYALKSCDDTKCYQTKYNMQYYPEYWPTYGMLVEGHKTQQSEGLSDCASLGCGDVITSHNIPNGFIFEQLYSENCPEECYWRIMGNEETDETNFLGTIDDDPLIIKTNSKERMRIAGDGHIIMSSHATFPGITPPTLDINVGTYGGLGRITFDNASRTGEEGAWCNPVMKLYRPNGTGMLVKTWWIEAGLIGSTHRLDQKTGPLSEIGSENVSSIITILQNGNVGIGVTDPKQELVVNGTICATEMRVSLSGSPCWEDYVFDKDYNLKTIDEVEMFIKQNKHLPDIPSATEVENNGIQLGEMQGKLLKKIEELTLYVIELKKEINQLKGRSKGK